VTPEEFAGLKDGDVIRSRTSFAAYMVQRTDGILTGVRVVSPSSPGDWDLVAKCKLYVAKPPSNSDGGVVNASLFAEPE
jgi:hypothetical protein